MFSAKNAATEWHRQQIRDRCGLVAEIGLRDANNGDVGENGDDVVLPVAWYTA